MALNVADLTGTTTPISGLNPFGLIKDNPTGTKVNVKSQGDQWVFFQKLMNDAGVAPNHLPDNTSNGFQLMDAFNALAGVPAIEARVNMDGDTLTFDKSRVIIYSGTPAAGIGVTIDMTGAVAGAELTITTPLSGTGSFTPSIGVTHSIIILSTLSIGGGIGTGNFRLRYLGLLSGTYYFSQQFFGY